MQMSKSVYEIIQEDRKKLTEKIVEGLEKDGLKWIRGWATLESPKNAVSEVKYRGGNALKLYQRAQESGYKDPRWVTFIQAQKEGWKLKAKSKGVLCEKWIFSQEKIVENSKGEKEKVQVLLDNPKVSYFTVFNAEQFEGIPKYQEIEKISVEKYKDVIENLNNISECPINYREQDNAYYSLKNDEITMPLKEKFHSEAHLLATLTHEIAHSTGHETRLNRNLMNKFGSEEYAREELRAEIASIFILKELNIKLKDENMENHQAYVNSWIQTLKSNPNEIYKAASDSEKITDRVIGRYREKILEKKNTKELDPWCKKIEKKNDKEKSRGR